MSLKDNSDRYERYDAYGKDEKILYTTFSSNDDMFITCTDNGFNVYSINPPSNKTRTLVTKQISIKLGGGIGCICPFNQRKYPGPFGLSEVEKILNFQLTS